MTGRPSRYDVLFEPVRIGPVVTKNRFYQVPHCNGMGRAFPSAMAAMRAVKAEGGWGVVCTEQCDIHYSGNHQRELRLWDEQDVPTLARAASEIHEHGALAGIELVHNGISVPNLESRVPPLSPSGGPARGVFPVHARSMDKRDIAAFRRWHRAAALRARTAGYDIVYVYAGHEMTLPLHFLSRRYNQRTDEYGGSLENRARLLRELIVDTRDAVGDRCAVALRFGVDALVGSAPDEAEEARAVVELLAELPDLWDVNLARWNDDGATSRFADEGHQATAVKFVKTVTTKPVVGVGRFTSPDTMVAMVSGGTLDLIGAARPSIADPFLPRKIEEGRFDDIRECIGCNVCVAWDKASVPIRCTQNPTMGEEWRRGWHPERLPPRDTDDRVLVVGGGPAGLEAARALGGRGYSVVLAERRRELGGRVALESRLPGLGEWARVRDWRTTQIRKLPGVEVVLGDEITGEMVLGSDVSVVAVATGSRWRRDGVGRTRSSAIAGLAVAGPAVAGPASLPVFTPDDIMAGRVPQGRVVVFDDDHYYLGGVVAELLAGAGCAVTFVTPESMASAFTAYTTEQPRIQRRLLERCVAVETATDVVAVAAGAVELACAYTRRTRTIAADALVLVTSSVPEDGLFLDLVADEAALRAAGIRQVVRIGDCLAPGTIAAAVHSGHLFGRTLRDDLSDDTPYRRESVELAWQRPLP